MRVAAVDIGTNTVLLLIAEHDREKRPVAVVERARITRLGQGVDKTRVLAPEAVERTLACLREYGALLREHEVAAVDVVGTSALRDAKGGGGFATEAEELLGVAPRVVSGEEEARLTFMGGVSGLALRGAVTAFDVGGGSTEIVRGRVEADGRAVIDARASLDVGSVRLFERLLRHDPPSASELAEVRATVDAELTKMSLPKPLAGEPLVGIAGTVTTLAAVAHRIDPYDGARVHGLVLTSDEVDRVAGELGTVGLADRRKLPGMEPNRADVIVAGACIVQAVLAWAAATRLRVSDRGVRWGLALELLAKKSGA